MGFYRIDDLPSLVQWLQATAFNFPIELLEANVRMNPFFAFPTSS